jgi:cellulose synthase/poly-beta-1,6-N-acetylglucosamine synthase-like glycosyltransferase
MFIIFYAYIGYGLLLYLLIRIKRLLSKNGIVTDNVAFEPEVTLFCTAYNERDYVDTKIQNSLMFDYPKEKTKHLWVTDGSDDGTPDLLRKYPGVEVLHQDERAGKLAAMNRGMAFVKTPIVIFSDGNTLLGKESVRRIVNLFQNPDVGCVSGEKRVLQKEKDSAVATEGFYWKYESKLKKWDAELYSVVGAAGELFAIRTKLYQPVENDTILDDFIISLRVAKQGFLVKYDPEAYAIESSSADIKNELKRKVRIAAGGFQSIIRLKELLNIFKYGILSFQYISHRVLRWTLAPLGLLFVLILNIVIVTVEGFSSFSGMYSWLLMGQIAFYLAALTGWFFENRKIKIKILFIPYYFFMMNVAVYLGFVRYVKGGQSVKWEKAKRSV